MSTAEAPRPPLVEIASLILPAPAQTAMLRACVLRGPDAVEAWRHWERDHGGARAVLAGPRDGVKRLLPMLAASAASSGVELEAPIMTCLRTAHLRETVRARTYAAFCRPALDALRVRDVPFVVLRGAALAWTVYDEPALRHCHDIDLLVHPDHLDAARDAMANEGYKPIQPAGARSAPAAILVHPSGLPVMLHERLFHFPTIEAPQSAMVGRARTQEMDGGPATALAPDDALLHICGHAATTWSRDTLCWICDAWLTIDRHTDLDWDRLADSAGAGPLAQLLHVSLGYLSREFGAPVPARIVQRLAERAGALRGAGSEAIFFAAAAGARGGLRPMLRRAGTPRSLLALARWLLLPSPNHLRWRYGVSTPMLPLAYPWRVISGVFGRLGPRAFHAPPRPRELPSFMADPGDGVDPASVGTTAGPHVSPARAA